MLWKDLDISASRVSHKHAGRDRVAPGIGHSGKIAGIGVEARLNINRVGRQMLPRTSSSVVALI